MLLAEAHVWLYAQGAVAPLLITEPGAFLLTDDHGEEWWVLDCGPVSAGGWRREEDLAEELLQAGHRLPDDCGGYTVGGLACDDPDLLPVLLAEEGPHPVDE